MTSTRTAEWTTRLNVVILVICSVFLVVCVLRQLWFPALLNGVLIVSNGLQLKNRRRPPSD